MATKRKLGPGASGDLDNPAGQAQAETTQQTTTQQTTTPTPPAPTRSREPRPEDETKETSS